MSGAKICFWHLFVAFLWIWLKSPWQFVSGKTAKSILISCGARLAVFDIAELREVTAYDELELDTLGDRKTALFLIMSDTAVSYTHLDVYKRQELCSLLTEILLDNYSIFSVNGIEPQIEIPNMDIYLNADRNACIRIIQNLIFNAVTSTTNNAVSYTHLA